MSINTILDVADIRHKLEVEWIPIFSRWIFLLVCIPFCTVLQGTKIISGVFIKIFLIVIIYNMIVTVLVLKNPRKRKKIINLFSYIDIIVLSMFSYVAGGIQSDTYGMLFFVICYYGITNGASYIARISIFSALTYLLSGAYFYKYSSTEFYTRILALRVIIIIAISYGLFILITQVKKYDDMHKREFKLARTDKLTGLPNRHYLDQKLGQEVLYSNTSGSPINVLMFDLDNFKKFNDSYGHLWGDKLLRLFADIIMESIRKEDIPIRYGGEEFLILIRDLEIDIAKKVGERISALLEKHDIYINYDESITKATVSCGIAQYPLHSNNIKQVIDLADKALYAAKKTGKNRVLTYDPMLKFGDY